MTDEKKPITQRVNRKNRKDKIEVDHKQFMPPIDVELPDLSDIDIPDSDAEALESLQHIDNIMRPLIVTPSEERYPPLPKDGIVDPLPQRQHRPQPKYQRPRHSRRNNTFTLLFVLLTAVACGLYGLIWVDPQTPLNLLAPPTSFQIVTATADANPVFIPSPQPTLVENQATPTSEADDLYPYAVSSEGVVYVSNQNGRECNWASIAGAVTNANNDPLPGFGIRVSGDGVGATVFSGTNPTFGAGGYELNLGGAPTASTFTVQLVTVAGAPLSEALLVTTRDDCNQNVAIVNFIEK